jgi:glycosyltransferase involved in cell wall biosynthesis
MLAVARKPRILLVTTGPLLPPNSGGRIYTWGTTAPLRDEFEYHLIAVMTAAERAEFSQKRELLEDEYRSVFASWQFFDRPELPGHMRRRDALRHLVFHTKHRLPLMDVSYYSSEVVAAARRVVSEAGIDLIEVDHAEMAYVRRFLPSTPAVLVNHNIEGDLHPFWMTKRWSLPERLVWRAFAGLSRRNTHNVELRNSYLFSAKLFISPVDAARVDDACPKVVVPLPMPTKEVERRPGQRLRLLWLGGMDWPPNLEGVRWLLTQVVPILRRASGHPIELHVVGGHPPHEVQACDDGDMIRVHGYVEDVGRFTETCDVLVAPIFTGSGVNVKVVEALASGMVVVTTRVGLSGLAATPGRDLLVADTAQQFAAAVIGLAQDPVRLRRLGESALSYVQSNHDPSRVTAIKSAALRRVLSGSGQAHATYGGDT